MQTFLPYPSFLLSAKSLDWQRLGCQRKETFQILTAATKGSGGWYNHPATVMWKDHLHALCNYGITMSTEWLSRGYVDNMRPRFYALQTLFEDTGLPPWIGNEDFHISHRSNLLRKGKERLDLKGKSDILDRYRSMWPDVRDDLPYVWPSSLEKV